MDVRYVYVTRGGVTGSNTISLDTNPILSNYDLKEFAGISIDVFGLSPIYGLSYKGRPISPLDDRAIHMIGGMVIQNFIDMNITSIGNLRRLKFTIIDDAADKNIQKQKERSSILDKIDALSEALEEIKEEVMGDSYERYNY